MGNFNKKLGAIMLLIGVFGQIRSMDNKLSSPSKWTSSPTKRPRPEGSRLVPAAPKKKKIEPRLRKISSFKGRLDRCEFQDRLLRASTGGTAEEIQFCLLEAQASDINPQILEGIFSTNTHVSLTELQKIDFHKQLSLLGVNLEKPVTSSNENVYGMNLLQIAADNNEGQLVTHILNNSQIDPNSKVGAAQWTAIHFTTKPEVVRILARAGVDPQTKDADGNSAADLIVGNTTNDKKLKVCLATHGVFPQYSTLQEKEELAKMTCHTVAQTTGKPLLQWIMNRQCNQYTPSFYDVPIKFDDTVGVDSDGSNSENE